VDSTLKNALNDVLLEPFQLKHLTLRNRIISTAHAPSFAEGGHPKERYRLYHEEKAKGGAALTIVGGSTNVSADSPSVFGQIYAGDNSVVPWFRQLTTGVKNHGCAVMCQLTHMGRRTSWDDAAWLPVVGPSGIRERAHRSIPKIAEKTDLIRIIDDFAAAAVRCQKGGFDGVEILSHGHLLGQFLSPIVNQRNDDYGGSLENRLRLTEQVLEAVRGVLDHSIIVGIRLTCDEGLPGGITLTDSTAIVKRLEEKGLVDYINVLTGAPYDDLGLATWVPPMGLESNSALTACKHIKASTELPILHAGGINDLSTARFALQEEAVDLVGMTRAQIADPHLVNKLIDAQENTIRPCVGMGYCVDRVNQGKAAVCGHNAATGRESVLQHKIFQRRTTQSIVVVGGGPGGMEVARIAAQQGHRVQLFEAASRLGGQLNLACKGMVRKQMSAASDWLIQEIERHSVEVHLNSYAEASDILALHPDLVVIATGGQPEAPTFAGSEFTSTAWDILTANAHAGERVLLWDELGNHAGSVIADYLSRSHNELIFVTPDAQPLCELGPTTLSVAMRSLYRNNVSFVPNSTISNVEKLGNSLQVSLQNTLTGRIAVYRVDDVVIENGTQPNDDLFIDLVPMSYNGGVIDTTALSRGRCVFPQRNEQGGFQLVRIGDAVASRNIHAALLEANRVMQWLENSALAT